MKELYIRHYLLDGPTNFRDLGGFLTIDNKITKFNLLYRADRLDILSPKDIELLHKIGVRTIIDLRSESEIKKHPDIIPQFCDYITIPLMERNLIGAEDSFMKSMQINYGEIIKYDQKNIKKLLETIDEKLDEGGIIFHCSGGKDRTGVLAAILLMLFGVTNEDIIADYETSYTYNYERYKKKLSYKSKEEFNKILFLLDSKREYMKDLLKIVNYKNIEEYLLSCGIKKDKLTSIKSKCLKPLIL